MICCFDIALRSLSPFLSSLEGGKKGKISREGGRKEGKRDEEGRDGREKGQRRNIVREGGVKGGCGGEEQREDGRVGS